MAVKIRLSRIGKTNRPYYRIVAIDSRAKRDGACIENLGTFDPIKNELIQFHEEQVKKWIGVGAICTDSVVKLMKMHSKKSRQVNQV